MSSPSYPVFDPVTPKVSILAVGMKTIDSALELVKEAEQQAIKFLPQASLKANFMRMHYKEAATKCILRNGTGVRLELFEADSKGILPRTSRPRSWSLARSPPSWSHRGNSSSSTASKSSRVPSWDGVSPIQDGQFGPYPLP